MQSGGLSRGGKEEPFESPLSDATPATSLTGRPHKNKGIVLTATHWKKRLMTQRSVWLVALPATALLLGAVVGGSLPVVAGSSDSSDSAEVLQVETDQTSLESLSDPIEATVQANPGKDVVLVPAGPVLSGEERRRMDEARAVVADAKMAEWVQAQKDAGIVSTEPWQPSPCQQEKLEPVGARSGFLMCDNMVVPAPMRLRDSDTLEKSVTAALTVTLEGPTADQAALGFYSSFRGNGAVESVALSDAGILTVDFSEGILKDMPKGAASSAVIAFVDSLANTVFQFPAVQGVFFEVGGDCERFWTPLENVCNTITRSIWAATVATNGLGGGR